MTCDVKRCKRLEDITWLGINLCDHHWGKLCDEELPLYTIKGTIKKDEKGQNVIEK